MLVSPEITFIMLLRFARRILFFLMLSVFFSCDSGRNEASVKSALFTLLPSSETGINFSNPVEDSQQMNIFNYHNFYNGGGVATGDINNDGRPDIFFTGNQHGNKLYINKGNWKFE